MTGKILVAMAVLMTAIGCNAGTVDAKVNPSAVDDSQKAAVAQEQASK